MNVISKIYVHLIMMLVYICVSGGEKDNNVQMLTLNPFSLLKETVNSMHLVEGLFA